MKQDQDGAERICIDTTSYELAQQIVFMCSDLGINSNLVATTRKKLTRHQGFRISLRVTARAAQLLQASIKIRRITRFSPDQEHCSDGSFLVGTNKEVLYTDKFVYDIKTASAIFVAGGLISHNSGGVYEGREAASKSIAAGGLDRITSLLYLPKKVRGAATLAKEGGPVTKVEKDPAGGHNVWVGSVKNYVPAGLSLKVEKGTQVRRGDPISSGPINVHDMLPLTKLSKVQGHLASELHGIYGQYGIRRRHSETIVRAMTNVTKIQDPGAHPTFLPGDFAPTSEVYEWNRQNQGTAPINHVPVVRGVKQIPLDVQTDWMARLGHEQLKGTLVDAAQQGWGSALHGSHPLPPLIVGAEFGKGTKSEPWSY